MSFVNALEELSVGVPYEGNARGCICKLSSRGLPPISTALRLFYSSNVFEPQVPR